VTVIWRRIKIQISSKMSNDGWSMKRVVESKMSNDGRIERVEKRRRGATNDDVKSDKGGGLRFIAA
jgi:hypothetical protein